MANECKQALLSPAALATAEEAALTLAGFKALKVVLDNIVERGGVEGAQQKQQQQQQQDPLCGLKELYTLLLVRPPSRIVQPRIPAVDAISRLFPTDDDSE